MGKEACGAAEGAQAQPAAAAAGDRQAAGVRDRRKEERRGEPTLHRAIVTLRVGVWVMCGVLCVMCYVLCVRGAAY